MTCYWIDPLRDSRWPNLIERHPASSIFHTIGWLTALQRTYGFEPVAITTTPPDRELKNAIVLCRVRSWLTGRRLVSLPFSDHCEPLAEKPQELQSLFESLARLQESEKWKYVELRPLNPIHVEGKSLAGFVPSSSYFFHSLDLRASLDTLMAGFHKDCVRRKIRRAERDGVTCDEGRSEAQLRQFYALQLNTRRRQMLPPQPYEWFRNLAGCLGDQLKIRITFLDGRPIASILTLQHKKTVIYKYGCSDEKYSNHGGTQLLFWRMIQEARSLGLEQLDLGRTDCDHRGLVDFKDRWGATKSPLTYIKYPASGTSGTQGWKTHLVQKIFAILPDRPLSAVGSLLYRHFA